LLRKYVVLDPLGYLNYDVLLLDGLRSRFPILVGVYRALNLLVRFRECGTAMNGGTI
jgi:hypothetical protein